ncbi:hypothetical protein XENOCAPTIV_005200, partial [Xenoophorus captivus]
WSLWSANRDTYSVSWSCWEEEVPLQSRAAQGRARGYAWTALAPPTAPTARTRTK